MEVKTKTVRIEDHARLMISLLKESGTGVETSSGAAQCCAITG